MSFTIPEGLCKCSRCGALLGDWHVVRSGGETLCPWCSRTNAAEVREEKTRADLRKERDAAYRRLGVKVRLTRSGGRVVECRGHIPGGYRADSDELAVSS